MAYAAQPVSLAHAHNSTRLRDSVCQAFHVSILLRHRPFLRFAFEGRAWQYRILPFGLSLSPRVLTKVVEGALSPVTGGGRQDPQLPRRLAYPSPIQRAAGRSQGLGAPAPQPVGSTGKRASSPLCRESLFSVWS